MKIFRSILIVTTPNEKQFYDSLAPDLKKKVDDSRAFQAEARAKADRMAIIAVRSCMISILVRYQADQRHSCRVIGIR